MAGDGARGYTLRGAGMRALDGLVPINAESTAEEDPVMAWASWEMDAVEGPA